MSGLADAFIDLAGQLREEGLPDDARRAVETFLLDTIGVGIAGRKAPLTEEIRRCARDWHGLGACRLLGGGGGLNAAGAAFVNGFQIHCQEFDCVHEPAVVHPMATVAAALLAEAESADEPVSGRRLSEALALAVELAAGLGVAVKSPIKFFRPANAGIFGSALGVAYLRGYGGEAIKNTLGYALAFCSGTMQAHVEGKPALPVQIANAARGAIMAADLAQAGVSGPSDSLEGPFGYFALFEDETDPGAVERNLARPWRITEVSHKPFPTGRAAHGGLVLVRKLRERLADPDAIAHVLLTAPPLIERLVGRAAFAGMPVNHARLSFPYLGALMILEGRVGLDDFSEAALSRPDVLDLARKIEVESDGSGNPAAFVPQHARITLDNGDAVEETIDRLLGSPAEPLSKEEAAKKFAACLRYGFGRACPDLADGLVNAVGQLDQVDDVRLLMNLASPETME